MPMYDCTFIFVCRFQRAGKHCPCRDSISHCALITKHCLVHFRRVYERESQILLTWYTNTPSSSETTHTLNLRVKGTDGYVLQDKFSRCHAHVTTVPVEVTELHLLQKVPKRTHNISYDIYTVIAGQASNIDTI